MDCNSQECERRITTLENDSGHMKDTLLRIEGKLDKVDAKISNGLSEKVTAMAAHQKYIWAAVSGVFLAIALSWVGILLALPFGGV